MGWGPWVDQGTAETSAGEMSNAGGFRVPFGAPDDGTRYTAISTMLTSEVMIEDYDPPGRRGGRVWPGTEVASLVATLKSGVLGLVTPAATGPYPGYFISTNVNIVKLANAAAGSGATFGGSGDMRVGWSTRGHGSPTAGDPNQSWRDADSLTYPIGVPFDEAEAKANVSVCVVAPRLLRDWLWPPGSYVGDGSTYQFETDQPTIEALTLHTSGDGVQVFAPAAFSTSPAQFVIAGQARPGAAVAWPGSTAALGTLVGTVAGAAEVTFDVPLSLINASSQQLALVGVLGAAYDNMNIPVPAVGSGFVSGGAPVVQWGMDLRMTVRYPRRRVWETQRGWWLRQRQVPSAWHAARQARPPSLATRQDRWR